MKMPLIMIHIDSGGNWDVSKWFFDNLLKRGVEFDVIGQSYYPFWHGTLEDLEKCLVNCASTYKKPVVIVETSFPWALIQNDEKASKEIVGIMPGKEGQVAFVEKLNQVLAKVPDNKGVGIFWWAAEYIHVPRVNMASFDRQSFFDAQGNALPVMNALGRFSTAPRPK
jgi:arabinogalactan endo-1,4-beta-galactosidase